jgi:hypothetical protein
MRIKKSKITGETEMNWIKGFTYVFEDGNWVKKMLVGSLVTSVPLAEAVSNGYQIY